MTWTIFGYAMQYNVMLNEASLPRRKAGLRRLIQATKVAFVPVAEGFSPAGFGHRVPPVMKSPLTLNGAPILAPKRCNSIELTWHKDCLMLSLSKLRNLREV